MMLESARQNIEKYALGKRVAVAVSGGEDSMALLYLFSEYAATGALQLQVVNVEHGIRATSANDTAFVRDYCAAHNIPFASYAVDIPVRCAVSGRGVEEEAHHARREIFQSVLKNDSADLVATAHHARDNAETVLLHLFRGCGLRGLSGMSVLSGGIFRPLLSTQKEEIEEYVRQNDIPYVVDESNVDTRYDRNYIRKEILPRIVARFSAAERSICRTAAVAANAYADMRSMLCEDAFYQEKDVVSLKKEFLSPPYVLEALRRVGRENDVYTVTIESVLQLKDGKSGASVDLGDGYVAAAEYDKITFYRKTDKPQIAPVPFVKPQGDDMTAAVGNVGVRLVRASYPCPTDRQGGDGVVLTVDTDTIPDGCVWRRRRDGDVFTPYGGGTRKLKEYLIDKKVPKRLRDSLVLLCRDNQVLLIAGMEISDGVKVTEKSKNVYRVHCLPQIKEEE